MRLLLVRHGRTDHNDNGLIQGVNVGDINQTGREQLKALANRLAGEGITQIISSDASRCRSSVTVLNQSLNLEAKYTELLREKDNGDFVGMDPKQVDWSIVGSDFENGRPPNGESLNMVKNRTLKFLENFIYPYKNTEEVILAVSHGGTIKTLVGTLIGLSLRDAIFNLKIENASLTELHFDQRYPNGFQLVTWAEVVFDETFQQKVNPYILNPDEHAA